MSSLPQAGENDSAVQLKASQGSTLAHILSAAFFLVSLSFVYRSFYGMRIRSDAVH